MAKTAILHIRVEPGLLADVQARAQAAGLTLTEGVTLALRRWLGGVAAPPTPTPRPPLVTRAVRPSAPPDLGRVAEMTMREARAARFERMLKARE